ncbi:solute:Na+ symporter, SSS family/sodium/pantothenate symporter [Halobacillus karajensis]|uniref:Symporter YodF n=1 Tax=Halobacillus karajensis TaxID=195088 RepID=A0A059NZ10_9BACI|nr:sodium:solute symporter family protein [Halobacillus karajensis]CDQ18963.1 putative symporter YodF [Halobacillus karajensis]CDQ22963.1 putative symporter YodF [Halobacillus karajensis]CDQ26446.1 putative symporter YodF [Halobacillus karajensis]SEH43814.1 solute:Na+ symporter, SSS family/sodium/pantothenate symporter [Halobacillus karajensis]
MELAFSGWSGILILLMYGLIMLGVGITTYLRNRNIHQSLDEYYLGGRGLGVMVLFFTFFATQYSGNTVIGYPPSAYRMGFEYLVSVPFFIMIIMAYLLFAPRLYSLGKKYKLVTPAQWFEKRFKSKAVTILAALLMLYGLGNYLLEQLVAIGQGVSGLTGGTIPYQVGVIFFVIIMVIYGWLGGMRSVAYTDTMQGIALLFGVFMLLIGSIVYFGGLPTSADYMQAYSPEKLGVPDGPGVVNWFSLLVLIGIGAAVYPHAIQRIFAAKNERTLKRSFSRMAWMPFLTAGVVFIIGIIGINAFPGLSTGESEQLVGMMASAVASQHVVFYWAMVLLFGGVIAAIVSTADSVLLTFSSIISNDLYGTYINPEASQHKKLLVGKLVGLVAVGILILVAWFPPGTLYQIFVLKFELLIQIAPGLILGLYWNRLHSKAVFAGMLTGTIIASVMTIFDYSLLGVANGLWGLLINLGVCVIGSLVVSVSVGEEKEAKQVIGM